MSKLLDLQVSTIWRSSKRSRHRPACLFFSTVRDLTDLVSLLRYFRFATLDLISIATAPSIDGPWTLQGSVLDQPSIIDLEGNDVLWVRHSRQPVLSLIQS